MPHIHDSIVEDIKSIIKNEIVQNPGMTISELQTQLSKKGHGFERNYVARMLKKVKEESFHNVRRDVLERRVGRARDRFDAAIAALSKIGYWKWEYISEGIFPPTAGERIMALATIMKQDLALLETEVMAGIYNKDNPNIQEADWRSATLDPEKRVEIMRALKAVLALGLKNPSGRSYEVKQNTPDVKSTIIAAGSQPEGSIAGVSAQAPLAANQKPT